MNPKNLALMDFLFDLFGQHQAGRSDLVPHGLAGVHGFQGCQCHQPCKCPSGCACPKGCHGQSPFLIFARSYLDQNPPTQLTYVPGQGDHYDLGVTLKDGTVVAIVKKPALAHEKPFSVAVTGRVGGSETLGDDSIPITGQR